MEKAYLIYKGGGFIHGVPTRNLTKKEAEQFDIEHLIKIGLYELAKPPKPPREDREGE